MSDANKDSNRGYFDSFKSMLGVGPIASSAANPTNLNQQAAALPDKTNPSQPTFTPPRPIKAPHPEVIPGTPYPQYATHTFGFFSRGRFTQRHVITFPCSFTEIVSTPSDAGVWGISHELRSGQGSIWKRLFQDPREARAAQPSSPPSNFRPSAPQ